MHVYLSIHSRISLLFDQEISPRSDVCKVPSLLLLRVYSFLTRDITFDTAFSSTEGEVFCFLVRKIFELY